MDVLMMFLSVFVFYTCLSHVLCSEHLIRGLQPSRAASYDPSREFRCLDGSQTIPFSHVNDDYCDCLDGSDEPGTSACPTGSFFCTNHGYTPRVIPSNRVNDGICDCCDGADEYNGRVQCTNLCEQLGQLLKEEEARQHKLKMEGHEIYLTYIEDGQQTRTSKQARLDELQRERDEVDIRRAELEKRKTETEEPEKEAKERHEKEWEAQKDELKAERKTVKAKEAFYSLDENHDNLVSVTELQTHLEFDIDADGQVSTDEAKEYLEDNDEVTFEVFSEKIWDNIRQIYRKPGDTPPDAPPPEETTDAPDTADDRDEISDAVTHDDAESHHDDRDSDDDEDSYDEKDDSRDDDDDYDDEDSEKDDDDDRDDDRKHRGRDKQKPEEKKGDNDDDDEVQMPDYDENTKFLIAAADEARQAYSAVDTKYHDIQNEITDLRKVLDQDLGPNDEYLPLMEKCFDYTDREYTYSLCPFDRASQRSKSGGSETSLGRWNMWSGPSDYKYAKMTYDRGQNCWNGPDRSAKVHLHCGPTNELVSVTEPNRCEYRFVFSTPAACSQPPEPNETSDAQGSSDAHLPREDL